MAKRELATWRREVVQVEGGKFITRTATSTVRVMARAEGYAMVRHPHCCPIVVSEKDLRHGGDE